MGRSSIPLNNIKVASPCTADWKDMVGDNRVRFCGQCSLNVFNLSGMTKNEAEDLLRRAEGRLCVRFYRRADGTVLTQNCPVGLQALKRRVSKIAAAAASALLSFFAGLGVHTALFNNRAEQLNPPSQSFVMGDVALPQNVQPVVEQGETTEDDVPVNVVMGGIASMPEPVEQGKVIQVETEKVEKCKTKRRSLPIMGRVAVNSRSERNGK